MGEPLNFGAAVAAIADLTCEVRMWSDVAASELTENGRSFALKLRDIASAQLRGAIDGLNDDMRARRDEGRS